MDAAEEESYQIYKDNTLVVSSSPFADNEQRTDDFCLPSSANNQYVLKLRDSYGDSWVGGAWISVAGAYGNIVFKNYMTSDEEESFLLSLYYPLSKQQQWNAYFTKDTIDESWTALAFDDSTWEAMVPATTSTQQIGSQYFRKQFVGVENMAAYEIRVNYRHGVIVYLNGKEIFRDHMPYMPRIPTPSTASIGSYTSYDFHGLIRPAMEVSTSSSNILALELHFPTPTDSNAVEFDAYVAAVASSLSQGEKCFIYPYSFSITSSTGDSPQALFDYNKESPYEAAPEDLPSIVYLHLNGPPFFFNGLRVWPNAEPTSTPGTFVWEGMSMGNRYTTMLSITNAVYAVNEYRDYFSYFKAGAYIYYRFRFPASSSSLMVFEMQPMACALTPIDTILFSPFSYTVYAKYQDVSISPSLNEFSGCSIQPALPTGLTLSTFECKISGRSAVGLAPTVFTVTSRMNDVVISGTFSLEVTSCASTLLSITRSYQQVAYAESFTLTNAASQEVLLSVAYNSGQQDEHLWSTLLCVAAPKVEVVMGSRSTFWQENSFLTVDALVSSDNIDTIARLRYDTLLGLPEKHQIRVDWSILPQDAWQYKMGSVFEGWQTEAGWESATIGTFPASTNQIQLYKKAFNVASLTDVAGFVISLRYLYGCVIYLNGVEVFRNGVEGVLSTESLSTNGYTSYRYHSISLPVKTMAIGETAAVNYLQVGANTMAIAIVAQRSTQKTSYFDCTLRLAQAGSRVFGYSVSHEGLAGRPEQIANFFHESFMGQTTCGENSWTLAFEEDRREWIASLTLYLHHEQGTVQPRQFTLKARNNNLEAWTTLKTVTDMTWSLVGEKKKLWVENNKPYNQYRFENFGTGDAANCKWKMGAIDLGIEVLPPTIPELAYSSEITVFKNVEMGEVYPNSEYFFDFTVTPALPESLSMDANTGKISGTAQSEMPATTYTITAKKVGGGSSTTTISLAVEICTGGKSLITLVIYTDSWPYEGSYKLFTGRGVSGEVVASSSAFPVPNGLNYADWCLSHSIYTVELQDAKKDGWANPAGWWLTTDVGAMLFEMGQMPPGVDSISTSFSSNLPFQIEYDDWKLFNRPEAVSGEWKEVAFDDAAWTVTKAAAMGDHMTTTAYIRHEIQIPNLNDYHVLNIRIKYTGGVVVYFNNRMVARFNLVDNFDRHTEGLSVHDATAFSTFHVILSTVGAVAGKNVIAFEIHRSVGENAVVFDATGVFAVNDCSVVLDTFSAIESSTVSGCTKEELLDLNPTTFGSLSNTKGSFLQWTVENLQGSKWNSFALQTCRARTNYGFSLLGRWEEDEEFTPALEVRKQETKDRARLALDVPVGLAGFKTVKFVVDHSASDTVLTNAYVLQYCKASGSGSCPVIDDFPAVGEGQISASKCPEGFQGYAYRECVNGVLSDVKSDKCEYKLPAKIQYENNNMEFVMNTEMSSGVPSYRNIITEFYMQDSTPLPEGLSLDSTTGEIAGKPVKEMNATAFTVRGRNPKGETFVKVMIGVRKGYCQPEGVFEKTPVGEEMVIECSQQGSYVGTQRRACVLGVKDGEWQKVRGVCVPVVAIGVAVVVVIAIGVVVVLLVRKTHKKVPGGAKERKIAGSRNERVLHVSFHIAIGIRLLYFGGST